MTINAIGKKEKLNKPNKLNPRQLDAAYLITAGHTVSESAEKLGLSRQTVSVWKNQNPLFRAKLEELDAERDEEIRYGLSATHVVMLTQLRKLMQEGSPESRLKTIEYFNNTFPRPDKSSSPLLIPGDDLIGALTLRTRSRHTEN